MVEKEGLPTVQKVGGFRDHILKGNRKGQRSVYLNKKWWLIYAVNKEGRVSVIIVTEVIPHDY